MSPTNVSQRAQSVASFKVMDVLRRANELQQQADQDQRRHSPSPSSSSLNNHNNNIEETNKNAKQPPAAAKYNQVLHCEVGQPETGAPRVVAQAAVDALTSTPENPAVLGYTDAFGLWPLREKIAAHYAQRYDASLAQVVDPARIVVTTGSSGAFLLAFTACFDAGDVVAIASAGYPCYRNILSALDCSLAHVAPLHPHTFSLTAVELRAEIQRRARANEKPLRGLILSSPSNPTGTMLSPDEMCDLCALCDQEGITFISDEIYHGISYGKTEATALQFSSNAIVINSFSKYYSMSGWRLGWMVVPEKLVNAINSLQQNMFINAPTISQTAALKCWDKEAIDELEGHVKKYQASRALILQELGKLPGLDPHNIAPADGGFYVYVDLGEANVAPGKGSVEFCTTFLEEHYVALTPGVDFEDPSTTLGDRRVRISYAGGIDTVSQAMQRLEVFWPQWQAIVQASK